MRPRVIVMAVADRVLQDPEILELHPLVAVSHPLDSQPQAKVRGRVNVPLSEGNLRAMFATAM